MKTTDGGALLKSRLAETKVREATSSLIWEPPAGSAKPAVGTVTITIEKEIIALLERPIDERETHRVGNDRKEAELRVLLDSLTPIEAITMKRRLAVARPGDELVRAFNRITIDRRNRVTAYLDDTRRRIATRSERGATNFVGNRND